VLLEFTAIFKKEKKRVKKVKEEKPEEKEIPAGS